MQIQQTIFNVLFPSRCVLCDLTTGDQYAICNDCRHILPKTIHQEDRFISLFQYSPPISNLITQLKFYGNLPIAKLLAQEWIDFLATHTITLPDVIIPVPLHHARLKERGFNQALEIVKPMASHFQLSIDTQACMRLKNTEPQSHLSAAKRKSNVKNAFALSRCLTAKHVVIFDDVVTTGNTVGEIAALLQAAGVKRVDVWSCAKA